MFIVIKLLEQSIYHQKQVLTKKTLVIKQIPLVRSVVLTRNLSVTLLSLGRIGYCGSLPSAIQDSREIPGIEPGIYLAVI